MASKDYKKGLLTGVFITAAVFIGGHFAVDVYAKMHENTIPQCQMHDGSHTLKRCVEFRRGAPKGAAPLSVRIPPIPI
jgi:hypothetical protein